MTMPTLQKVIILCKRRDGISREQLRQYQLDHAALLKRLSPIKRYRTNFPVPTADGADPAYDLVVELWVEGVEQYQAALQTPEGVAARAHAAKYVRMDEVVVLVSDEVAGW